MKNRVFKILLIAAALALPMIGAHAEEINEWAELEEIFKNADIIPDGKLDKGEFDIYHYSAFNLMDTDKDGVLTIDECVKDCFSYGIRAGKRKAEPFRRYEFSSTPYRFEAIDIDGSGALQIYEYILFGRERFPFFDHDENGFIESEEFCSGYHSSMPCDYVEGVPKQ
jgi:hypothetical protein